MSRKYLISNEGNFYKTNLHCHTTYSDGHLKPEQIKELYKSLGYSIVAFTDHNVYVNHDCLNDDSFLAVAGFEADINKRGTSKCYHLNAFAISPSDSTAYVERKKSDGTPFAYNVDDVNEYIKKLNDNGFLVMYNHPSWSLQQPEDFLELKGLFAFEIYNHGCELENRTGNDDAFYSIMLRDGNYVYCTATDDNHNIPKHSFYDGGCGGGFIMLKSPDLSYGSVMEALRGGQFYSSQKPEIKSLYIEDNKICCDCSPVRSAYMLTKKRHAQWLHDKDGQITHVEFPFEKKFGHVRLELFDSEGKAAFTNPYVI